MRFAPLNLTRREEDFSLHDLKMSFYVGVRFQIRAAQLTHGRISIKIVLSGCLVHVWMELCEANVELLSRLLGYDGMQTPPTHGGYK